MSSRSELHVGDVVVPNRAFLAPMSGVTDLPFRRIAARHGAGMVVSEMVACEGAAKGSDEARLRAEGEGLDLHVVQLVGRAPAAFAEGVRVAEASGARIVDINMGCPARSVTGGSAGSALMRETPLALRIIEATVAAARVPVTLKMRLGWDDASRNAPELARMAQAAGVRMITIHGRTRCQFYKGRADWSAIAAVKAAVDIPVVANGDLSEAAEAPAMLRASHADAVMIGRGAYGRPWIVGQAGAVLAGLPVPAAPVGDALRDLVVEHYAAMLSHYGAALGLRNARKHLGWYLDHHAPHAGALRKAILTATDPDAVIRLLAAAFAGDEERRAA